MITRHITPSMIYLDTAPARWLRSQSAARDETAARLCRAHCRQGALPVLSPVPADKDSCGQWVPSGSHERPPR